MAGKRREKVREKDITGLKYFDRLLPLFERLHEVGCERDKAGNRTLHMDQYCVLVLLYLFNPICSSLRALQQASELKKVQRKLSCLRASLGSLSESVAVFDSKLLREIIVELSLQLAPVGRDARLKHVKHTLTLVDGSLLEALPKMAEASLLKSEKGCGLIKWRLHTQFEVDRYVPTRMDLTRNGGGDCDERSVLERTIAPDHCYVMDRGYAKFTLFNEIVAIGSSYVCRIRDNSVFEILEDRPLSNEAQEANIVQDAIVTMGKSSKASERPDHRIRIVTIKVTPHVNRGKPGGGGSTGPGSDGYLRLATNLLDVPPEIIALIYLYRWTIELFFRFFKHIL